MKKWYQSKGMWGSAIAVGSAVAGAFGYSIAPAEQEQLAVALTTLGCVAGGLLSGYGRVRAVRCIGKLKK